MKRAALMLLTASLLASVAATSPTLSGASRPQPRVVCASFSSGGDAHLHYRTRPHSCVLHQRGKPYDASVYFTTAEKLGWRYWSPRRAQAHGEIYLNMYGPAPLWLTLSRPRDTCGSTVFTRGRFKYRYHYNGHHHTKRFTMSLDQCD